MSNKDKDHKKNEDKLKKEKEKKTEVEKKEKKDKKQGSNEKEDYKYKYLRALADYQNLQKRSANEKQEFVKYANEQILHDIIPIYDNLKVSLKHTDKEAEESGWAEGIKYVIKQFKSFLEEHGVEEINTVGKKFDYNTMEAVKGEGEKVLKEIKPGYKLNGKVIVAAKVELGN